MPAISPFTSVTPAVFIATSAPVPSVGHRRDTSFASQPSNHRICLFGKSLSLDVGDTELGGDCRGGLAIVAREDDDADVIWTKCLRG